MIASFTGAQSTGKTTLLNHLVPRNHHISFVPEVTRLIKRRYKLPINEEGGDLTQYMIMNEHIHNVLTHKATNSHVILDRCALDGVVYTKWLAHNGKVSMDVYNYAEKIYNEIKSYYDVIFYTCPSDVVIEDDGERSTNIVFRNEVIELFNEYISKHDNIYTLSGSVEKRLSTIQQILLEKYNLELTI
jgi:predicted ATPase